MKKLSKKYILIALLVVIVGVLDSCKSKKRGITTQEKAPISETNFARVFQDKSEDWTLFSQKMKIDYSYENSKYSVNANLRMKKDSLVWLSVTMFGIEGARALIDKDSIHVLLKFPRKQYSVVGIGEIEYYTGAKLTLRQLQNLILGNLVLSSKVYKYSEMPNAEEFFVKGKEEGLEVSQIFKYKNLEPVEAVLKSLINSTPATVTYQEQLPTNLKPVPKKIYVEAGSSPQGDLIKIYVENSYSDFPENITFPFTVTPSYERVPY